MNRPRRKNIARPRSTALEMLEDRCTPAVSVVYFHNDLSLTGQNLQETVLTPANVNPQTFGKLQSTPVDGQVYAQPMYVPGVTITVGPAAGVHNVVYVATEHNSVYAIDADMGGVLWQTSFIDPSQGITTVPQADVVSEDLSPEIGITGTPAIDVATSTIYFVARTKEIRGGVPHYVQTLHALDMTSGASKLGGPVVIADTSFTGGVYTYVSGPTVNGTGDGSVNGKVTYNALRQNQRPAITLYNDTVYVMSASHGDNGPYHGWILGYDKSTLALKSAFNATPNGSQGGIWMAGAGFAIDAQGYMYVGTSNGTFGTQLDAEGFPVNGNYANSILKLALDPTTTATNQHKNGWGLKVVDYFTPYDQAQQTFDDLNIGSAGLVLLPDSVGSAQHPHLMVTSGKNGTIYLIDRDNLGKFDPTRDNVVQTIPDGVNGLISTPAYFNGSLYFVGSYTDVGKKITIANGQLVIPPASQTSEQFLFPGATPSISANGTQNAIAWMLERGSRQLRAYRADNLTQLWNSEQVQNPAARDEVTGGVVKFTVPVVADGKVFVGSGSALVTYGLFSGVTEPPAAPTDLSASTVSSSQVHLVWVDRSTNESGFRVEYSTDGVTFSVLGTLPANATEFFAGSLQPSTPYYFRVRSTNAVSDSAWSNVAQATTNGGAWNGINLPDGFANAAALLQRNGSTEIVGSALRLTDGAKHQRASSFYLDRLDARAFTTQFSFRINRPTNESGDGFTFVIQGSGLAALGPGGGSLGYGNATLEEPPGITKSMAIKFDISSNAGEGTNSTGLYVDGAPPTVPALDLTGTGIDLNSQHIFVVTVTYDGSTLSVQIRDSQTNAVAGQSYSNVDLPTILGATTGWFGFTGSTGDAVAIQDILSWTYAPLILPAAPNSLAATAGANQVSLSWQGVSEAATYNLYRSTFSNGQGSVPYRSGLTGTSFVDTSLNNGVTYYYKVTAVSPQGESARSNEAFATTPTYPARPSDQFVTDVTETSLRLGWKLNSTNETGVRILRRDGVQSTYVPVAVLPPGSTSFADSNLTPGEQYSYHIVAFNDLGFADFAGVLIRTVSAAPTGLSSMVDGSGIQLTWNASLGAATYSVYRSLINGGIAGPSVPIFDGVTGTSLLDTTAGKETYVYRVQAVNETGTSLLSNPLEVQAGTQFVLGSFESGQWILDADQDFIREASDRRVIFGQAGDIPVVGDWNGDGMIEIGVFRAGTWYLDTDGTFGLQGTDTIIQYGVSIDLPVVGDWNGDGRDDLGVFRQGSWFLDANGILGWQGNDQTFAFGVQGDIPIAGDWDGNGRDDIGAVRGQTWYLDSNNMIGWQGTDSAIDFGVGLPVDRPVVGDWDGDGVDDLGVYRSSGDWFFDSNGTRGWQGDDRAFAYGIGNATPVTARHSLPEAQCGELTATTPTNPIRSLTQQQLAGVIDDAISLWKQAGLTSAALNKLRQTEVRLIDLEGDTLALSWARGIAIDATAADRGWYVDPVRGNEEFTRDADGELTNSANDRFDLLTVVLHEQAHLLGVDHEEEGLMSRSLKGGIRRLPTSSHVDAVLSAHT